MNIRKKCYKMCVLLALPAAMLNANQGDDEYYADTEQSEYCSEKFYVRGDLIDQPECCSENKFYVRGDLLYWTPRATGLELNFGTSAISQSVVDGTDVYATEEVDMDPHFEWSLGFRVGAGFEDCQWGVGASWTHFNGKGCRRKHGEDDVANHGRVKIKLDQVDIVFASNCDPSSCFTFKPFAGLRAAKIDEHIHALLTTTIAVAPYALSLETRVFRDKQKYWGAGPLLGVQGNWEVGCGFGLYGTAAVSLLYGKYSVHFDDIDTYAAPTPRQFFGHNKRHLHAFDWNTDLALGLSWQTFLCNQYHVDMKLGFELHQFFNQNRLSIGRGDISFTGLVYSLAADF